MKPEKSITFSGFYRKRIKYLWKMLESGKNRQIQEIPEKTSQIQENPELPLVAMAQIDYNEKTDQQGRSVAPARERPKASLREGENISIHSLPQSKIR